MARSEGIVSIDNAWQSVSLEERLELISRAQATGIVAAACSIILAGCVAYGWDQIWLLAAGAAFSVFMFPLFSSYSWRREKPAIILAYLAVRTVARRYAYGYSMPDIDIIFIYRAQLKHLFKNKEDEAVFRQKQKTDIDSGITNFVDVWIVLLRGGVVIMSEKQGGAKLEFLTHITHETVIRTPTKEEEAPDDRCLVIEGANQSKGQTVMLSGRFPAAHYVFEKRFSALIEEQKLSQQSLENLRTGI